MESVEVRFWAKVDIRCYNECWNWIAGKTEDGYGKFCYPDRYTTTKAHRVSWIITNGVIIDNLCVLHKCDNRLCVNPNHLYLGTHSDNMRDMCARYKGRLGRTNRFTANEVFDMRTLNSNGVTQEAIANKFNVSRQYISSLISGKWGKNLK